MKSHLQKIVAPVNSTLRDALKVIDRGGLGVAILTAVDSLKFKGIITDGDARRALLRGVGLDDRVASHFDLHRAITVNVETPFNKVLELFSPAVRVIPILDEKSWLVDIAVYDKRRSFPVAEPSIDEREWQYVSDCVLSGWVSSTGEYVNRFESLFADFCGVKNAISTSNGTTALHLALLAADIGPGDEVIVPTLTFIATANAVLYTGATPVFVDSEISSWNLDPAQLEPLITERTKAIIPVHLYGQSVDMDPVCQLAEKYDLCIVEDAAEAHGAEYKGKKVGSIGTMGIFSFFGNKIITTGEGGMLVTDDDAIAERVRLLRDHGMDPQKRYWHTVLGYNYRLTNLQAALGVGQMEKIETILLKKRSIAKWYQEILSEVKGITLPVEVPWGKSVFWLYSILIEPDQFGMSRDELMISLREEGIETRPVFFPVHLQPVYGKTEHYPVAERVAANGISLPSSPKLDKESVFQIGKCVARLAG